MFWRKRKKRTKNNLTKNRFSFFERNFRKEARRKRMLIPEPIKPWVYGIFVVAAAFFILLSFFGLSGTAGIFFIKGSEFLVGHAVFTLPLILFLAGFCFFLSKDKEKNRWSVTLSSLFAVLGISGFLGALDLRSEIMGFFSFSKTGMGGWVGNITAWPLMKIFGFWVTQIVFICFIVVSGLMFWYFLYKPKEKEKKQEKELEKTEKKETIEKKPFFQKIFAPKFKVLEIEDEKKQKDAGKEAEESKKQEPFVKKELLAKRIEIPVLEEPDKKEEFFLETKWNFPPLDLLASEKGKPQAGDVGANEEIIKNTLENFGIPVEMSGSHIGPTVTQYTLKPADGVKLSKITALNNNLALALAAHPIRIEAPIPGKSLVGIEVPNKTRALVTLRELFTDPQFQSAASTLNFVLGRDVVGNSMYADLSKMPHLLVAGSTGSGKTITLGSIILSLLYRNSPYQLRLVLIDPKRVEFSAYNGLPHLLCPVIYDVNKTLLALKWLGEEMERRFEMLSKVGARNIDEYNQKIQSEAQGFEAEKNIIPYIAVIVDELADLIAAKGREIEAGIVKLAQKARAVGIHLILATQRPSVEVITGLIKANITSRIACQVASQVDSRTILDTSGAEKLLGRGDMLFLSAEISKPKRIQGAYVSGKEIEKTVEFIIKNNSGCFGTEEDGLRAELESEFSKIEQIGGSGFSGDGENDPVYEEAKQLVLEYRKASASFLQRKLRIGYARAARILDILEEKGIVGPADGAKPREVFYDIDDIEAKEGEEESFDKEEEGRYNE